MSSTITSRPAAERKRNQWCFLSFSGPPGWFDQGGRTTVQSVSGTNCNWKRNNARVRRIGTNILVIAIQSDGPKTTTTTTTPAAPGKQVPEVGVAPTAPTPPVSSTDPTDATRSDGPKATTATPAAPGAQEPEVGVAPTAPTPPSVTIEPNDGTITIELTHVNLQPPTVSVTVDYMD